MDLNHVLEKEQKKSTEIISKQVQEAEEARKKVEEGEEQQNKMKARMNALQSELEQTIKRIEQIQRGGGGFGARANARLNFSGNSQGSRNSSNLSRGNSNSSANKINRFYAPKIPAPRSQTKSLDRAGSGAARSISNKASRFLPQNYKPPHLRGNSNIRVSPNRPNGVSSSGYGPSNRASPNLRQPLAANRKSPGSRLYENVQSKLHNPAPRITREGALPVKNLS